MIQQAKTIVSKYHSELLNDSQVIEKLSILPTVSNRMKFHMIWNSWKKGSYLEMLDDLFAFEKPKILPTVSSKKNIGNIFGEVGWFAGCRTTLVPAEKKWKRQTFNSSNCEICFPNIFHQKFLLKGTQESGNSYILQKAKVKASNVKVVRDNKIGVFWFPSLP